LKHGGGGGSGRENAVGLILCIGSSATNGGSTFGNGALRGPCSQNDPAESEERAGIH